MSFPHAPGSARQRVLVVEDEPLLALMLEEILLDGGFAVAGVATRVAAALQFVASGRVDAAVLDCNLAGASAAPVALALAAQGAPFVVLSGYAPEQQDAAFACGVRLKKPCTPDRLLQALRAALPKGAN
jgi:CheY-like chemotaxis protein